MSPHTRSFDSSVPFSRAEARAAGLPLRVLLSEEFHKVCHDQYVAASVPITTAVRARATLGISPPGSHISHHTATELWGGIAPASGSVHVTLPTANGRCTRAGVKAHVHTGSPQTTSLHGVRLSTPEQCLLDLAASGVGLVEVVVAGDSLVKAQRTTPERLVAAAAGWTGRGCRLARRAASLVRCGVDSPMETRLRLLIVFAGLPEPRVNLILRAADGSWRRRFDLCYPNLRLIIEYDGRQHAEDNAQWLGDITRREELDRMGWRIVIITSRGIYAEPLRTLQRIREALLDCGATGLRRGFDPEWRRHFSAAGRAA